MPSRRLLSRSACGKLHPSTYTPRRAFHTIPSLLRVDAERVADTCGVTSISDCFR
jgi:hypothetical protein